MGVRPLLRHVAARVTLTHGVAFLGALRERKRAATVTCILPRSARFEVHPIVAAGRELGSIVAVLDGGLRRVLLLVVLDPRESRIFYAGACRTG